MTQHLSNQAMAFANAVSHLTKRQPPQPDIAMDAMFAGLYGALGPYLPPEARELLRNPAALYVQRGKFLEGSLPYGITADGKPDPRAVLVDAMLKLMFGLATNTTYRGDMDGAIRTGGGIFPILRGDSPEVILAVDGEFHNGKKKTLGGQTCDADRGNTWHCAIREVNEELGDFTFVRERAWLFNQPLAWRDTDGRMEYPVTGDFYVYPIDAHEVTGILKAFQIFTKNRKGDPEVVQLYRCNSQQLVDLLVRNEVAFPEQREAFLLLALVLDRLTVLKNNLAALPEFWRWALVREMVTPFFNQLLKDVGPGLPIVPSDVIFRCRAAQTPLT